MGNGTAGFIIGLVIGVPLGILGNIVASYLWDGPIRRRRRDQRLRRAERDSLSYMSEWDRMYAVNPWSPERQLTRSGLRTQIAAVPRRLDLVDPQRWHEEFTRSQLRPDMRGRCGYVTSTSPVDWHESRFTQVFRVTLSPADYSEGIATYASLLDDPDRQQRICELLGNSPMEFIEQAPPMHLAANVAVLSADGLRFLGVLRSGAVATSRNIWTVGPCETLVLPESVTPGDKPEDFFSLVERCLSEELALGREDYGNVSISWFGYYGPDAHPWITAQVRAVLSDNEVKERWHSAPGRPEAKAVDWFPFDRQTIESVIFGQRDGHSVVVPDGHCRGTWIIHAPHALYEAWRMRPVWQDQ